MLADPGAEGSSAQLGAEAGASPLFKWTSDGSMMEELMKAYKYARHLTLRDTFSSVSDSCYNCTMCI